MIVICVIQDIHLCHFLLTDKRETDGEVPVFAHFSKGQGKTCLFFSCTLAIKITNNSCISLLKVHQPCAWIIWAHQSF